MYMGAMDVKVRIKGATSKKRLGTPDLDWTKIEYEFKSRIRLENFLKF